MAKFTNNQLMFLVFGIILIIFLFNSSFQRDRFVAVNMGCWFIEDNQCISHIISAWSCPNNSFNYDFQCLVALAPEKSCPSNFSLSPFKNREYYNGEQSCTINKELAECQNGKWVVINKYSITCGYTNITCTQDVKLCSDGSYVGRIVPYCEFKTCPDEENPIIDCQQLNRACGTSDVELLCGSSCSEGFSCVNYECKSNSEIGEGFDWNSLIQYWWVGAILICVLILKKK